MAKLDKRVEVLLLERPSVERKSSQRAEPCILMVNSTMHFAKVVEQFTSVADLGTWKEFNFYGLFRVKFSNRHNSLRVLVDP